MAQLATERHLPYGITQCYLLPDTSEHTPLMFSCETQYSHLATGLTS